MVSESYAIGTYGYLTYVKFLINVFIHSFSNNYIQVNLDYM